MASEREMELLDDYLRNKLSAQDKSAFEEVLRNDAGLQKEMRVQQQVVNSLRNARVAELKQMLNNVPVTALPGEVSGPSVAAKVAAWLVMAGLVGGGLYIYYNSHEESGQATSADVPTLNPSTTPAENSAQPTTENITPPVTERDATAEDEAVTPPVLHEDEKTADSKTADSIAPAARNVFEPTEEAKSNEPAPSDSGKGVAGVVSTPSIAIEAGINGNNGKYNFHYQFKDNKLFLYGVFEKNLYELMEFFSNNKRTLFLYYKDNYYLLSEDDNKIKRLSPISDPALVKKLKDYRSTR